MSTEKKLYLEIITFDTLYDIIKKLDFESIVNIIRINDYFIKNIWNNNDFWLRKYMYDFGNFNTEPNKDISNFRSIYFAINKNIEPISSKKDKSKKISKDATIFFNSLEDITDFWTGMPAIFFDRETLLNIIEDEDSFSDEAAIKFCEKNKCTYVDEKYEEWEKYLAGYTDTLSYDDLIKKLGEVLNNEYEGYYDKSLEHRPFILLLYGIFVDEYWENLSDSDIYKIAYKYKIPYNTKMKRIHVIIEILINQDKIIQELYDNGFTFEIGGKNFLERPII